MALQNTRTSGESYNFRYVFQNNVDQANRTATQDNTAPNLNAKVHITENYREKATIITRTTRYRSGEYGNFK